MTTPDPFRVAFLPYLKAIQNRLATAEGDWAIKGFIDIEQNIYPMSLDTKVLSKVIELMLWPIMEGFSVMYGYQLIPAAAQNHYPDLTFIAPDGLIYALDIKTTYRTTPQRVNGMTLGTFMGYFRNREQPTNSTVAYNRYFKHYVLGIVYSRVEVESGQVVYSIDNLAYIPSATRDFSVLLYEKYQIASDQPGSGNTTNIGSVHNLESLLNGRGVFSTLGVAVFDDYWMHYQTRTMARDAGFSEPLYRDLRSYQHHKQQGATILNISPDELPSTDEAD